MSLWPSILVFSASLFLASVASAVLAHRLDQLGTYLGFSAGLLGLVTALAADSPEISSAVSAIADGKHDLGAAVIFGSNIFNLAALLGLSAVAAGRLRCRREQLLLHGSAGICVAAVCALQFLVFIPTWGAGVALMTLIVPYLLACTLSQATLRAFSVPASAAAWLHRAVTADNPLEENDRGRSPQIAIRWPDVAAILPLLVAIIVASMGMVRSASTIGSQLGLADVAVGTLVLAPLTGVPNLIVSLRLAMKNCGAAVVSEAFNSNTLNLITGTYLPTLFVATLAISHTGLLSLAWLLAFTAVASVTIFIQHGLTRIFGAAFLAIYVAYVAFILLF